MLKHALVEPSRPHKVLPYFEHLPGSEEEL